MRRISRARVLLALLAGASLLSCSDGPTGPAPITSVSVSPGNITLASGASSSLSAVALDANGKPLEGRVFAWSSSDISVANVSPAGIVTAGQNRGGSAATAVITALSEGKSGTATVSVTPVPASRVVLSADSVVVQPGASATLSIAVEDAGGAALSGRSISWSSLDTSIARVSATGQVTATSYAGPNIRETRIVASAEGKADTARVVVPPLGVARVVLTPDSVSLQAGATQTLMAVAQDAAGSTLTGRTISWASTDTSIATISSAGVLAAQAYTGPATRSARIIALVSGKADTSTVVVTPIPVGRVNASPDSVALLPGGTATLTAAVTDASGGVLTGRTVTWSSSDTTVVAVSLTGAVSAKAYTGGVTRTAQLLAVVEGQRDSTKVVVTPLPVSSVSIAGAPTDSVLVLGDSLRLTASLSGSDGVSLTGRTVTWSSSDVSRATVSASGVVTSVGAGIVTITATSESKNAGTAVLVKAPVTVPPASATQPVTTTVLSGAVSLTVPPGATTAAALTVAPAPTPPADDRVLPGAAYVFGPAGTTFSTPVTIGLRYDPSSVPSAKREKLRVALVTASGLQEVPGGTVDLTSNVVSVAVSHFSTYTLVVPPDPASVEVVAGGSQEATVGTALSAAPQVRVLDAQGRPISRERVRFTVAAGGGTLSDTTSVVTDASGLATMLGTWTLGSTVGAQSLTVAVVGSSVTGTITAMGKAVPVATVTVSPSTATVAVGATQQLLAELKDANGNVLTGRAITWSSGNTTRATVSSDGVVTAKAAGEVLITATVEGKSGSATITIPAPVATVTVSPSTATVAVGASQQLTAELKDASGTVLTGRSVTWTSSNAAKATVSASGLVTTLGVGEVIITATSETIAGTATLTIGQTANTVELSSTTVSLASIGATAALSAVVKDGVGGVIADAAVTWSSSNPAVATVANGTVTAVSNGTSVITATSGAASTTVAVTVAQVATKYLVTASSTGPTVGGTVTITAQLADANGNAVTTADKTVTWSKSNANGSFAAATSTTNASGIATVVFTVHTVAGTATTVTATDGDNLTGTTATITTVAGAASQLAIVTAAAGAASGAAFTTQPVIEVRDAAGNRTSTAAPITLEVSTGGTVAGTATVTSTGGVATFVGVGLSGVVGDYTLTYASTGLSATTQVLTLNAGAPAQLVITTQPVGAVAGEPLATPPVVELRDNSGNRTSSSAVVKANFKYGDFDLSWTTVSPRGTIAFTRSVTAVSGVATFTDLSHWLAAPYTIQFEVESPRLTTESDTFTVSPAAPSRLAIVTEAAGAVSPFPFSTQPVIEVRDALGNRTNSANTVTVAVSAGGAVLGSTSVIATAGVASFAGLGLSGPAGNYTLTYAASGLVPAEQTIALAIGVQAVSTGDQHTMILKTDGTLWATGLNSYGQQGNGPSLSRSTPVQVMTNVMAVSAGYLRTMILKTDGTVWAVGINNWGQLGDGTRIDRATPVQVMTNAKAVSGSFSHTMILKTDGTLWATGQNSSGQLGDGTTIDRLTPVQVMTNVQAVSTGGAHTMILKTDGTVWAAGRNSSGELGDGTTTSRSMPVQVMTDVQAVSASIDGTRILKTDGTLWANGRNLSGELGDGTTSVRLTPVQVMTNVQAVSTGNSHAMILKADGTLWSVGENYYGTLGDGTTTRRLTPVQVMTNVQAVSAGGDHTMIVKKGGSLWATGGNYVGQLGDGTTTNRVTPVRIVP